VNYLSGRGCLQPSWHDAALHFLARPKQYPQTDAERADLVQVVEGYTSPHDHDAARRGIEWMPSTTANAAVLIRVGMGRRRHLIVF